MKRRRYVLVLERDRHLKWRALDPVEHVLMILCGLTLEQIPLMLHRSRRDGGMRRIPAL